MESIDENQTVLYFLESLICSLVYNTIVFKEKKKNNEATKKTLIPTRIH